MNGLGENAQKQNTWCVFIWARFLRYRFELDTCLNLTLLISDNQNWIRIWLTVFYHECFEKKNQPNGFRTNLKLNAF